MDALLPPFNRRHAVLEVVSPQGSDRVAEPDVVDAQIDVAHDFLRRLRRELKTLFAALEGLLRALPELPVAPLIERASDCRREARESIFKDVVGRTFAQSLHGALFADGPGNED